MARDCLSAIGIAMTTAAILGTLAGCSTSTPAPQPGSRALLPPILSSADPSPRNSTGGDTSTPTATAEGWLATYRSASWTDSAVSAWVDRVRPYVTDAQHARDEQLRDGIGGADWDTFVTGQCTSTVENVGSVIPAESPGTATTANIEVTATVRTTCATGQPTTATENAAATLALIKTSAGWRIDQRVF